MHSYVHSMFVTMSVFLSCLTGFSTDLIALIFGRRESSVGYQLQADSQSSANGASSAVSTASSAGTLNTKLVTQLSTTSYSGSTPTGTSATATINSNASSSDSDHTVMWILIGVGALVAICVALGVLVYSLCRDGKHAHLDVTSEQGTKGLTPTQTYIERGLHSSEIGLQPRLPPPAPPSVPPPAQRTSSLPAYSSAPLKVEQEPDASAVIVQEESDADAHLNALTQTKPDKGLHIPVA